jgi:uncharacterized protein
LPSTETSIVNARPTFMVDGSRQPRMDEGILAMELRFPRGGMACAELRLANWGTVNGRADFSLLDLGLGARLEVALDDSRPVFKGEITALEERYGEGAPQLVVLAEDALHRLARRRDSRAFEDMGLDDVISQVIRDAGLDADVRVSTASGTWLQNKESDLGFLLRLLEPHDVGLRWQDGKARARDEERDPNPLTVDPAKNADSLRVVVDLARQPKEAQVQGYDMQDDNNAQGSSSSLSPSPSGRTAMDSLRQVGWEGAVAHRHPFARSQAEADAMASRRFRHRAERFLHGEVICRDASAARTGGEIILEGVSPRLAGRYRIEDCVHRFDLARGLSTRLGIHRSDWNP